MTASQNPAHAPESMLASHAWYAALAAQHQALAARETLLQSFAAGAFIARHAAG